MSDGPTHYEVLEITPDASPEAIKRRFREMARQYHPDMHPNRPEMHEVYLRISEAYEVLRDPSRRAAYDLLLRDRARRQADARAGAYGSAPQQPPRPGPAPTTGGKPAGQPGSSASPAEAARAQRARMEQERRRRQMARLMEDARTSFQRGHLRAAQHLCREVLKLGRAPAAYEMLGDILARQGRLDEAIQNYTLAAQMAPSNGLIMAKLNNLVRTQQAATFQRVRNPSQRIPRAVSPANRLSYQLAFTCFGLAVLLFLMVWPTSDEADRLWWPLVPHWTLEHLLLMAASGFLCGIVLTAAVWIRPFDQELLVSAFGGPRRGAALGGLLFFSGLLCLPLALLIYVIIAHLQGYMSRSIVTSFVCALALTVGFTFTAPASAHLETLCFGGNVIFAMMLCGWFVGEIFRPGWA